MFRLVHETVARLLTLPRVSGPVPNDWDLAQEARTPDPYVWRLPSPGDARWRRWAKRSRAAGYHLPFPHDEECWGASLPAAAPLWASSDDVVRPYVLRP